MFLKSLKESNKDKRISKFFLFKSKTKSLKSTHKIVKSYKIFYKEINIILLFISPFTSS